MNYNQILEEWAKDAEVIRSAGKAKILDTALLHSKYIDYARNVERLRRKYKVELREIAIVIAELYTSAGTSTENLERYDLEPVNKIIKEKDKPEYVKMHPLYVKAEHKYEECVDCIKKLDSIIQMIMQINQHYNSALNYERFVHGEKF